MINKVTLLGTIAKEPKLFKTKDGKNVLNFVIMTTETYKKDGKWTDKNEWHEVVQFDPNATTLRPQLFIGQLVYVDGKLSTSSYDKNGTKVFKTNIQAQNVKLCSSLEVLDKTSSSHPSTNSNVPRQGFVQDFHIDGFSDPTLPF